MKQHSRLALAACAALLLAACERKENRSENERTNTAPGNTGGGPTTGAQPTTPVGSEMATSERKAERKGIEEQPGGAASATGGGPIVEGQAGSRSWARDKLANARCDHFQTCGDVAKGKKYDTFDSCVTRERADLDKSWNLDKCQRVDTPRLDSCLKATRDLKCGGMTTKNPDECDQDKVCMAP